MDSVSFRSGIILSVHAGIGCLGSGSGDSAHLGGILETIWISLGLRIALGQIVGFSLQI